MPRATKREVAAEVWQAMSTVFFASLPERARVLADCGLTPGDFKALMELDELEARPMRDLADTWMCDASNVTWMVDRLEERGLVERRAHPTDRRIKTVVLTGTGAKTRRELLDRFGTPPNELLALDRGELEQVRDVLGRLVPGSNPFSPAE